MDVHGGDGNGGEVGGGERDVVVMKKGPWTAAEDAVLVEYVRKHGEGNWNAVMRNSGLQRCGKSCRLRWANHLRPNLKKGAFSHEEERAIIQLHSKYGNKWARMASQLPGRTDNEIKNYWNTRLKRRQRAGLPIYPQEIQREAVEYHLQQQQKHKQDRHHRQRLEQQHPHSSSPSIASFFPSSSTSHPPVQNPAYNRPLSVFDSIRNSTPPNPIQSHPNSSFFLNPNRQLNFFPSNYNDGFALPLLSPVSPASVPSPLFNQSFTSQLLPTPPSIQFNPNNIEFKSTNTTMGDYFVDTNEFTRLLEMELPSSQTTMQSTTPASSATSGGDHLNCPQPPPSNTGADDYDFKPLYQEKSSGLLDDMLKESQTISRNANESKGNEMAASSNKGKELMDDFMVDAATSDLGQLNWESNENVPLNQFGDSSSAHSSIGMKSMQEPMVEMNSFEDDELSSILKTFDNISNGLSGSMEGGNVVLEVAQEASPPPSPFPSTDASSAAADATIAMDHELTLGFCCWNNMPTIL